MTKRERNKSFTKKKTWFKRRGGLLCWKKPFLFVRACNKRKWKEASNSSLHVNVVSQFSLIFFLDNSHKTCNMSCFRLEDFHKRDYFLTSCVLFECNKYVSIFYLNVFLLLIVLLKKYSTNLSFSSVVDDSEDLNWLASS